MILNHCSDTFFEKPTHWQNSDIYMSVGHCDDRNLMKTSVIFNVLMQKAGNLIYYHQKIAKILQFIANPNN